MRALFGATSFSMYSAVVCAIILCSSLKSSGEKTRLGVVSVIRKLPPLKIVFCVAAITQSFQRRYSTGSGSDRAPANSALSLAPGRYRYRYCTEDLPHQVFKNARRAHSAADAHSDHPVASLAALHLVKQRGRQLRPRATERVAERDRAAVDVQPFEIEVQLLDHRERLRGEGFVEFDQIDLLELQTGRLQRLRNRDDRSDSHFFGRDASSRKRDESGHRL